ncbi:amiloride-sensitive sodium channel subunit gamma-like [Saccostrea cucullata]|uniref:amiloride-sensitive sodium channel subunit gamma-like n=2 Tax=Saccostrea cuccullata TaxID=36930 RepID=UPI002ED57B4D
MDAMRKPKVVKKKVTKDLPPPEVNETDPLPMEAFTDKKPKFAELVKRNLDSINNVSLKERTENFINETSFTAIARIVKANTIVKKILWLILVLAMMSWLGIQCYWLFDKYFSYPVEVKIELKSAPKLAFPSVTVCNRNPLKKSKLRDSVFSGLTQMFDLKTDDTLYNGAMDRLRDQSHGHEGPDPHTNSSNLTALVQEYGFNMWDGLQNASVRTAFYKTSSSEINAGIAYASTALLEDDDVIEEFGHQKMDMITSCVFAGNLCSPENFTYLHNSKYGNCYTFNSIKDPNPPLYTYYAGPLMGMTLEFNIQQDEYISALAPDAGIRVSIHERGTYPFPEDDGFTIAPGMATSVALKRVYISRLEPQHGNCSSNPTNVDEYMKRYEFSYHRRTCLKSCYQQKLIDYCDCACSNFIVPKNVTNICNYDNESIRICTMETIKTWDTCEEKCPSTCQENKYETMVTASAWPSEAYEDYLESRMKLTTSEYMSGGQKTKMDNNLVKLEIFFAEMTYESIESQKAYESQNLISDVGGQLGLWLGLSAITVGEIFEFAMSVFRLCTAKFFSKRHRTTDSTPITTFKSDAS